MKRRIYIMYDQVSGQYGGVFDYSGESEMCRAMKIISNSGQVPEHVVRDTVIIQLAEYDISGNAPVVTPLMPVIVCRMEEFLNE